MKKTLWLAIIITVSSSTLVVAGGVATGVKVGTLGIGADITIGLHERINLRGSGNYLAFDYDDEIDDIDYNLDLDFKSGMALLDWHPFANGFRISGGAVFSENDFTLTGTPNKNKTIGNHTYTPDQIGSLEGDLDFEDVAPYAGIGFGQAVGEDKNITFIFDLGVIFQSYDVELNVTGPVSQIPQFQSDLKDEEQDIQEDLDGFELYPVLAFGISYKF